MFKKILLAIAALLLFCFFVTVIPNPFFPNAATYNPTFSEWILFIIPIIIILLYKLSEKLFSAFSNFLSNRFCSYLSNEELYFQHETDNSKNNDSFSDSDYTSESFYEGHENYSDFEDSDSSFEKSNFTGEKPTINLFSGIQNLDDLKKRYRDLLKIYHPDNSAGDEEMTKQIQAEYEELLEYFNNSQNLGQVISFDSYKK